MPVRASEVKYADLIVGDGAAITSETQNAIMARVLLNGTTGELIQQPGNSVWSPQSATAELAGVDEALRCATEGSRIVVAIPAADLAEGLPEQIGLGADDSLVAVYDVRYTLLSKAEGRDVFNAARGLPSVVRAPDGRPGIIVPGTAAPKDAVTETLIEGEGEGEGEGDKVGDGAPMFNYTAVGWSDREVTGTSWDGQVMIDTQSLPAEVGEAISEATVGSQLMVVVPGDSDATVYVVDVLGIIPEELTQG